MVRIGVLLIVFGVGSLLLPMFDLQFRLMSLLDDYQPVAGIVLAGIGAILVVLGMQGRKAAAPVAVTPATPVPAAPESPTPPTA